MTQEMFNFTQEKGCFLKKVCFFFSVYAILTIRITIIIPTIEIVESL